MMNNHLKDDEQLFEKDLMSIGLQKYLQTANFQISFQSMITIYFLSVQALYYMSDNEPIESCQLIGFAGIMIQIILGALSFSVLVYKRYTQTPKRAWKIWAMDTSKQGVSQMLAHIINVAISMQLSNKLSSDACIWYFTTNVLDNTVGVILCVVVLSLIEKHILEPRWTHFQSGNYYRTLDSYEQEKNFTKNEDNNGELMRPLQITRKKRIFIISYFDWFVQFLIWNVIVVISKSLLFEFQILLSKPLIDISTFLLGWIQPYETLELILVIIIAPVIMNGFAFWFQDNFLKKKEGQQAVTPQTPSAEKQKQNDKTSVASNEPRPDHHELLL